MHKLISCVEVEFLRTQRPSKFQHKVGSTKFLVNRVFAFDKKKLWFTRMYHSRPVRFAQSIAFCKDSFTLFRCPVSLSADVIWQYYQIWRALSEFWRSKRLKTNPCDLRSVTALPTNNLSSPFLAAAAAAAKKEEEHVLSTQKKKNQSIFSGNNGHLHRCISMHYQMLCRSKW